MSVMLLCVGIAVFCFRKDEVKVPEENISVYEESTTSIDDTENLYDISKSYYKEYDDTGLEKYAVMGIYTDAEVYIRNVRELGYCKYIYVNSDQQIMVEMTEEQKEEWMKIVVSTIEEKLKEVDEADLYRFSFSDEYTVLNVEVSKDANVESFASTFTVISFNAELYQIFNGTADWSINIVTKDWETGKEISNINYPEEGYNLSLDMWGKDTETPYDTSKEYYSDFDDTGLETYTITGVFTDIETYIKSVRKEGYCSYIYEDSEQQIIVELTEQQKEEWIAVTENNIKDALAEIGEDDLYQYEFSDEYTVLVLNVSRDAKVETFMSSLTILTFNAELYQIFNGNTDWSINIVTKDLETGKEISNIDFPEEEFNVSIDMWEN